MPKIFRPIFVLLAFASAPLFGAAAAYPFPQNRFQPTTAYYPAYNNADIQFVYTELLNKQVTTNGAGGYRRVQRNGDVTLQANSTVSEGIGYGMIIAVYMNDQALFDDLWRYYNLHLDGNGLMHWYISADGTQVLGSGAATDADQDVAWALCMAIYQWGNSAALGVTYQSLATSLLTKIYNTEIEAGTYVVKPGDGWGGAGTLNVSYLDPSMYRVFATVSGNTGWNNVVEVCYTALANVLNATNQNQNNGLVPAWSTLAGAPTNSPQHHQYDSCRTPFRIAKDWYFNGEPRALAYLQKINSFHVPKGAANLLDGYDLNGNDRPQYDSAANTLSSAAFLAPAMVSAMCSTATAHVTYVQDSYDRLKTNLQMIGGPYYDQCWTVMGLLFASGNYLKYPLPAVSPTPTRTASPFGSPTVSPTRSLTFTISPTRSASPTASPTPTSTATATPLPCGVNIVRQRMVANTAAFTDGAGNVWAAEQAYAAGGWGYMGGNPGPVNNAISGTTDDGLYNAQRYGDPLEYRFTVPNGVYQLRITVAETYFNSSGARVFDIAAEGMNLATGLDIYARVGANAALDITGTVVVSDGILNIIGTASADTARFGAIQVTQIFGGTCPPSATASPSATRSATVTSTATRTASPSATRSNSPSPSVSPSSTRSPTPTFTLAFSSTASPSATFSFSPTATRTLTNSPSLSPSLTPLWTATGTVTRTSTPTATLTFSPSSTASITPTRSPTVTVTGTPSASPTLTASATPSSTRTASPTLTASPSSTSSPTPSHTRSPTSTLTGTMTATLTRSPTFSITSTYTDVPISSTVTFTPTASPSVTLSGTPSVSPSQTVSVTSSRTSTGTLSATSTFSATVTVTLSGTPSRTATATLTPSNTPSATATLTASPSLTISPSQTNTLTLSPTVTVTFLDTYTSSPTRTPSYTSSLTATPSGSPSLTATPSRTSTLTLSPTVTVTFLDTYTSSPTRTPSSTPSSTMTPTPSSTLTRTGTLTATPSPTATLTPSGTPSLTVTPTSTGTTSPTGTITLTATRTMTPLPSATPTVLNTATPLPTVDGPLAIEEHQLWPQPSKHGRPVHLAVRLLGPADELILKVYTPALVCVGQFRLGGAQQGWNQRSLPAQASQLPAGLYFTRVLAQRAGQEVKSEKPGRWMILP